MPSINLGRVKGDPLRYEDLTEAQKLELKGEKGDTPIVKAGTTTTLEFDQEAKVTSETNGDVTSFNFQIPIGQKPPFYGAYENFPETGDPNRTYIDNTVDPRLMYTWDTETQKYILTGGAGGADGSSIDIPVTLPSTGWTGSSAPYQQTLTVPQIREGMTPLFYLSSTGPDAEYAYSLITGYTTAYASITFYAADLPTVDLSITLKGIQAQEMEYVDNTIVIIVEPSSFALSTDPDYDGRYVATIPVEGVQAGAGGGWDIVRSGPVLSEAESKIALSITDVKCLDGSVEIVALEVPAQRFLMSLQGTYAGAGDGDIILSGMQEWFDRVEALEASAESMSKVISLTPEDIFSVNNAEILSWNAKKTGNRLIVYMVYRVLADDTGENTLAVLRDGYRPKVTYTIIGVRINDEIYAEKGTLWINEEGIINRRRLSGGVDYISYLDFAI